MATNLNQESGISGATAESLSVPQLVSAFSYTTEDGYIKVYLAKAGFSKLAIAIFDNTYIEYAYAVQTIVSSPVREAYEMVESAEKAFSSDYNPFSSNPFTKLFHDNEAMTKLIILFRKFLEVNDV
jgi:hypothetical protein